MFMNLLNKDQLTMWILMESEETAKAMAKDFVKFVEQEHLQQHLSHMSAGHILVLCIYHSKLSWHRGKPLQLHDRDHYWIPKPS